MRLGTKMMLWTCCAGPTVAAMVLAGAGAANASVTTSGSPLTTYQGPNGDGSGGNGPDGGPWGNGDYGQHGHGRPACDKWELERWNLNGNNTDVTVYKGSDFTYAVSFKQDGSCLRGTLTDMGLPPLSRNLDITGTVDGRDVTFSVTYPTTYQGTRTFEGTIDRRGSVAGTWSENGVENGTGTWSLGTNARRACTRWSWFRNQGHECFVRSPRI